MMGKGNSLEAEETQAKAMIDNALASGVKFFVYASGDRGGDETSFETKTTVLHWQTKYRVEHYLVEKAKGKMEWSILRPTGFMEVRLDDPCKEIYTY
jgi:nucleoside-diphosphate-sugar epimerase